MLRGGVGTFDCTKTLDGRYTLTADPSIVCDVSDAAWVMIVPWSYASIGLYGAGIPLLIASVLLTFRKQIVVDQALKEVGKGDLLSENPNLAIRKRFGRVYNDFKAKYYYWRLVLVARKLLLVLVAAFFNANAMFQASASVLVINVVYVAHSSSQPFVGGKADAAKFDISELQMYRFDYNSLESGLLLTTGTVLIGGMIFSSGALIPGSSSYWFIAVVIVGGVTLAMVSFVAVLCLEIFRAFKFAFSKPQTHREVVKPKSTKPTAGGSSKDSSGGKWAVNNPLHGAAKAKSRGKAAKRSDSPALGESAGAQRKSKDAPIADDIGAVVDVRSADAAGTKGKSKTVAKATVPVAAGGALKGAASRPTKAASANPGRGSRKDMDFDFDAGSPPKAVGAAPKADKKPAAAAAARSGSGAVKKRADIDDLLG